VVAIVDVYLVIAIEENGLFIIPIDAFIIKLLEVYQVSIEA